VLLATDRELTAFEIGKFAVSRARAGLIEPKMRSA